MGNCCTKRKKTATIEAVLVDDKNETGNLILNEEKRNTEEIDYIFLRRFSKIRQEWYCQDRNCMVAHDIQFSTAYYKTTPISETEVLHCSVCQKPHKIKWKFIEDKGIVIG